MTQQINFYLIFFLQIFSYKEFGGGTILDLGVYPLQLMLLTLGMSPYEIIALGSLNEQGVDENMGTVIRYGDGKLAIVSTHSKGLLPNEAFIIGTKGRMYENLTVNSQLHQNMRIQFSSLNYKYL